MTLQRSSSKKTQRFKLPTELKLFVYSASAIVPVGLLSYFILRDVSLGRNVELLVASASVIWIFIAALGIKSTLAYQLRTLNTLVEAVLTEDYSLHSAYKGESGNLGEIYKQINQLMSKLYKSRHDEHELRSLLERIITQINLGIVACNNRDEIILVNRQMASLLKVDERSLIGQSLMATEIAKALPENKSHVVDFNFPGGKGRWQVIRQTFVQEGKQGTLIFITDLEQVLSEEEIKAWQRLIKVIAHEVNNSLTPISTLCQSMNSFLERSLSGEQYSDLKQSLEVINERATSLKKFIHDYARVARLPDPNKQLFNLVGLIRRIKKVYAEDVIIFRDDVSAIELYGDAVHIEQLLINLIKNGLEANADKSKAVEIQLRTDENVVEIRILDTGKGISNRANLFVPFYTTKPQGAGIGLALCRHIVASHNGEIFLENRDEEQGAVATVLLPKGPNIPSRFL